MFRRVTALAVAAVDPSRSHAPRRRPQEPVDSSETQTAQSANLSVSPVFTRTEPLCMARVFTTESADAFVNPFNGRLTPMRSLTARQLLRAGFVRCATNPFRLLWDSSLPSSPATAHSPFTNSRVAWRRKLGHLLARDDAAIAVGEEVHRLYDELTSAYLPPKLDALPDPQLTALTMTPDQANAVRCALRGYSMFIGGSAGTGKTVLLKAIHRRLTEAGLRVAMTATTGVAAVQLGGCTFHLAFGVPFLDIGAMGGTGGNGGMGAPEMERQGSKRRWDANALRAVDVVIVDEVSLLDADLFDAFEREARIARLQPLPFGGLQVIVCGDFLQLATSESQSSGPCYRSDAFSRLIAVRLVTPLRQAEADPLFKFLSQLRVGRVDERIMKSLDRPLPHTINDDAANAGGATETGVTFIFPRRCDAQRLNDEKLCELRSEEMLFTPQRGPLQLVGNFTPAGFVEFPEPRGRSEIVHAVVEEMRRAAAVDVADHNVVVMPAMHERHAAFIRLRIPDERRPVGPVSSQSQSHSQYQSQSLSQSQSQLQRPVSVPAREVWAEVLAAAVARLGGAVRLMHDDANLAHVPLSVSMALADPTAHPNAEHLAPLRLKLGCRVMINRNLSRTVSNGSVGVVEAFAAPNVDLFPRRSDFPVRTTYSRLLSKNAFARLPIVRLLGGELVQVPPVALMVGGTPATYFYGHELYSLPLQLGYAFTVHKVQGLTLQGTVVLDCKNFFECPHLVYVACSRVRSLDQLIVRNLQSHMVIVKRSALEFSNALKDASDPDSFVPQEGCIRASWAGRHTLKSQ